MKIINNGIFDCSAHSGWPLFPVLLFLVCFLLSAIIPPFQSPDEFDHVKRAYFLTRGQVILDTPAGKSSGGMIDTGLAAYINAYGRLPFDPDRKLSVAELDEANSIHWTGTQEFSPAPGTGYYFPLIYAPQATGLVVGEMLGISVDGSYRLARFCVLASASLILAIAFMIYRPSPLAAALLVLPMGVFQLSSASLDGISTAGSILVISVFMRMVVDKEFTRPWLWYVLTASVIVVVSCRIHLLPLVLLIFGTVFVTRRKGGVIAGSIALVAIVLWLTIAVKTTVDLRVITGSPISGIIQHYLLNPLSLIRVLLATLADEELLRFYGESFLGILGWLDARFPDDVYTGLYALVFLTAIFSTSGKKIKEEWPARLLLVCCAFGASLLIFLALLVSWNVHPAGIIKGVQGRYFMVPALLIAYALDGGGRSELNRFIGLLLLAALFLFSAFNTTSLLLTRYYLPAEQPKMAKFEMRASLPATSGSSFALNFDQRQKNEPSLLKRIGIMFATYKQKNPGLAELRLRTGEGGVLVIPFDLSDLVDNQYKWFELDHRAYIAGEIFFLSGGGIGIWQVHHQGGSVMSCVTYEASNGGKRYTRGCPRH